MVTADPRKDGATRRCHQGTVPERKENDMGAVRRNTSRGTANLPVTRKWDWLEEAWIVTTVRRRATKSLNAGRSIQKRLQSAGSRKKEKDSEIAGSINWGLADLIPEF